MFFNSNIKQLYQRRKIGGWRGGLLMRIVSCCYGGVWCGISTHTQQLTAASNPCSMGSNTLLWPPQVCVRNPPPCTHGDSIIKDKTRIYFLLKRKLLLLVSLPYPVVWAPISLVSSKSWRHYSEPHFS